MFRPLPDNFTERSISLVWDVLLCAGMIISSCHTIQCIVSNRAGAWECYCKAPARFVCYADSSDLRSSLRLPIVLSNSILAQSEGKEGDVQSQSAIVGLMVIIERTIEAYAEWFHRGFYS